MNLVAVGTQVFLGLSLKITVKNILAEKSKQPPICTVAWAELLSLFGFQAPLSCTQRIHKTRLFHFYFFKDFIYF